MPDAPPSAEVLRATFDAVEGGTVGLEEEIMILDAGTLDLAPRATEVLAAVEGDPRFKLEMPAAQFELVTAPNAGVAAAAEELARARADLERAVAGRVRFAGAGAHPFAGGEGPLNPGARYAAIGAEYAAVAHRQLVYGLHVHVAVAGADRALAVYNALREHLPDLAALAVNAPFYEGRDSGLASVRSRLSGLLPRQGIPPVLSGWEEYARALAWLDDPRQWWWELRPHPVLGTIEVRVPDTQATVDDTETVAAVVHALVGRLCERHDAGEPLPAAESWRIDQNRWSACRHGAEGEMADVRTGERRPTKARIEALLAGLGPAGERARAMLDRSGAARQREIAAERGAHGLVAWLADAFPATRRSGRRRA